jgi:hypothetical protein
VPSKLYNKVLLRKSLGGSDITDLACSSSLTHLFHASSKLAAFSSAQDSFDRSVKNIPLLLAHCIPALSDRTNALESSVESYRGDGAVKRLCKQQFSGPLSVVSQLEAQLNVPAFNRSETYT